MRSLAILLVSLLMITPASAFTPASPPVGEEAEVLGAGLADAASLQALALSYPQGAGLGKQLATATGVASASPETVSFEGAMSALYTQAGVALPADYVRPAPALAEALAPVLASMTLSARLTDEAFAGLTTEERAFVLENIELLLAPTRDGADEAARVATLSTRVNMPLMQAGAMAVANALSAFQAPSGTTAAWVAPSGLIEVGSTGNDAYCAERMLIIDFGGNDRYDCHPASYAPGSSLPLPVSVILDLGGNDYYTTLALHASSLTSTWGQGVGIGGVGMIVDRWGDDVYIAQLYDQASWCAFDFYTGSPQYLYAQAVGALGVGAILDASGNDVYQAVNINDLVVSCHFGWVYTFAQAMGLAGGVGLLIDDTGDDVYYSYTSALGKYDNIAATFSQASSASGIATLVDKEGSDWYYAHSTGLITFGLTKGAFAYVFSQASVAVTRLQPRSLSAAIATDSTGSPQLACPSARGGESGHGASSCDMPGAAILIDILGSDQFYATTYADDQNAGCWNGLWSVVSAQGSAAWTGVAALINLDIEGSDQFTLAPYVRGNNCGFPGARAHAYGQGYGGPVLWDFWDLPQPAGTDQLGVGILASLGVPEETCPGDLDASNIDIGRLGLIEPIGIGTPVCKPTTNVPHLTASPDAYYARADATNPSYVADAKVWAQGASSRSLTIPAYSQPTYPVLGVGVLVDVGGDDTHSAEANANGPMPELLVTAQGATNGALAALANVGGDDLYTANALATGAPMPALTLVQGYADGGGSVSTPGTCVSFGPAFFCLQSVTLALGTGVAGFVEVFGWDSYSEAAERAGCMVNGSLLGTWPIGAPLGAVWWGHLIGNPCPAVTPDVGTGTVIGLDWWSDAY